MSGVPRATGIDVRLGCFASRLTPGHPCLLPSLPAGPHAALGFPGPRSGHPSSAAGGGNLWRPLQALALCCVVVVGTTADVTRLAHLSMLLTGHHPTARCASCTAAPTRQADLRFVLTKTPLLLDEMMKIAVLPRPPMGYGWMVSTSYVLYCRARHTCVHTDRSAPKRPSSVEHKAPSPAREWRYW